MACGREGVLEVFLISASNLKDTELLGRSDPYAVISCGSQQRRSSTAKDQGSHPVWNQKLRFTIEHFVPSISIKLFNENIFKDDEIGSVIVPVDAAISDGQTPQQSYAVIRPSGRPQGHVNLMLIFTPKSKDAGPSAVVDASSFSTPYPPPQTHLPDIASPAPYPPRASYPPESHQIPAYPPQTQVPQYPDAYPVISMDHLSSSNYQTTKHKKEKKSKKKDKKMKKMK